MKKKRLYFLDLTLKVMDVDRSDSHLQYNSFSSKRKLLLKLFANHIKLLLLNIFTFYIKIYYFNIITHQLSWDPQFDLTLWSLKNIIEKILF